MAAPITSIRRRARRPGSSLRATERRRRRRRRRYRRQRRSRRRCCRRDRLVRPPCIRVAYTGTSTAPSGNAHRCVTRADMACLPQQTPPRQSTTASRQAPPALVAGERRVLPSLPGGSPLHTSTGGSGVQDYAADQMQANGAEMTRMQRARETTGNVKKNLGDAKSKVAQRLNLHTEEGRYRAKSRAWEARRPRPGPLGTRRLFQAHAGRGSALYCVNLR